MTTHICDFLDESVVNFPDKIAFVENDKGITYAKFDQISNKLANQIIKFNKENMQIPVLILLPKGIDCIIAMFAALKSGNFYTILDEKSPKERLEKIVQILKPSIIITSREFDFSYLNLPIIFTQDFDTLEIDEKALQEAKTKHIDTNLAYVLFTSGSTGFPKGVSITHKCVIDYTSWVCETFDVTCAEILANQAPFYFDNSVLDIYSSIKAGATLHIIPTSLFSFPTKVIEYLDKNMINMVFWVPSVLIYFANLNVLETSNLKHLKKVLFAGEAMPNKQLNIWRKHLKHTMFANLYGPTEITVDCAYYICDREFKDDEPLPMGKARENMELFIFDENLNLITKQTPNIKGELYVRGTSLSVGYYKDEEKTKKAFIQNPLHNNYEEKIYKTGDIVAYNEKGEILYFGRADNQIKHMGYRIELGEIEITVLGLNCIDNACTLYDKENSNIILIYESKTKASQKEILLELRDKLPKYMLPTKFICLDEMPLNANGKIDRKKLQTII